MRSRANKNILSWTTIYDHMHIDLHSGLSLKMVPFWGLAKEEELKIDWKDVIEINSGAETYVGQEQWNQLIKNIEKFPRLVSLKIENCSFKRITGEDLQKLLRLEKIVLKKAQFKECEKVVEEFMKANPYIDMMVEYKWLFVGFMVMIFGLDRFVVGSLSILIR